MKKLFFLICLLVLVAAGCGAKKPQAERISGSIEDLLKKNKNIRCELIAKTGEDIISGTTYISGTKARSDYQNKMEGQAVTSHMINDGTWLYTWTEEYPNQAVKMKMADLEELAGEQEEQEAGIESY